MRNAVVIYLYKQIYKSLLFTGTMFKSVIAIACHLQSLHTLHTPVLMLFILALSVLQEGLLPPPLAPHLHCR